MKTFLIVLSLFLFASGDDGNGEASQVKIRITNISSEDSNIMVAIFRDPESFLTENRYHSRVISVKNSKEADLEVTLPHGEYAIAVFEDKNKNGVLDRNLFFYPVEPYGFSNNYHPTLRAPTWSEAAFKAEGTQLIEVELK